MRTIMALLAAGAAAAASPAIAAQQRNPTAVAAKDADEALKAITTADTDRLLSDQSYAQQVLTHVETVRRSRHYSGDSRLEIDRLRLFALIGSRASKEAFAQATQLTKASPGEPHLHYLAFVLAVETGSDQALNELELANRSLSSETDRASFRELLDSEIVQHFRRPFHQAKDKVRLARSAEALLNLGWPGPHKLDVADHLRMDVAEGLLAKGDLAGAKRLVFHVQTTSAVLQTLIARKWESVRDSADPEERLAQAVAATDEASERALRAQPDDPEILLARAQFLRSVGRNSEALQLLLPEANDLARVKEKGEIGFWIVNEAAYALVDLQREKDAFELMQKLLSLGLPDHPSLISMAINSVGIRIDLGDYKGAADYAAMLANTQTDYASPYGSMWMWQGAVCGNSFAGNAQAAEPWLAKLKAGEKDNPAALTRALLCANDIEGAAASVIRRLEDGDPVGMLAALQDYSVGPELRATKKTLEMRLRQVVARPDVQAAIAKHGRVLKVPLSRSYWGLF